MENGALILSMIGKNGEKRRNDYYEKIFSFSSWFCLEAYFHKSLAVRTTPMRLRINLNNPYGVDIPLSTKISYKNNDNATFDDIFNKNGIPKLLIMGYYDCDMMCDAIREILFADLNSNEDVRLGIDYEIIMLSIDHDEPLSMAMKQEEIYF